MHCLQRSLEHKPTQLDTFAKTVNALYHRGCHVDSSNYHSCTSTRSGFTFTPESAAVPCRAAALRALKKQQPPSSADQSPLASPSSALDPSQLSAKLAHLTRPSSKEYSPSGSSFAASAAVSGGTPMSPVHQPVSLPDAQVWLVMPTCNGHPQSFT